MAYIPEARKWLLKLLAQGWEWATYDDLDRLMMREFDVMCYENDKKYGRGPLLFNSVIG